MNTRSRCPRQPNSKVGVDSCDRSLAVRGHRITLSFMTALAEERPIAFVELCLALHSSIIRQLYLRRDAAPETDMSFATTMQDDATVIRVPSRFDFRVAQEFDKTADAATRATGGEIVIDFAETDYLDSSALGMLLVLRDRARSVGSQSCSRGPAPQSRRCSTLRSSNGFLRSASSSHR